MARDYLLSVLFRQEDVDLIFEAADERYATVSSLAYVALAVATKDFTDWSIVPQKRLQEAMSKSKRKYRKAAEPAV